MRRHFARGRIKRFAVKQRNHPRASAFRFVQCLRQTIKRFAINNRGVIHAVLARVALLHNGTRDLNELFYLVRRHIHMIDRDTDLPCVQTFGVHNAFHRQLEIKVVQNNRR